MPHPCILRQHPAARAVPGDLPRQSLATPSMPLQIHPDRQVRPRRQVRLQICTTTSDVVFGKYLEATVMPNTTTPMFVYGMCTTTPKSLDAPSSTTIAVYIYRRPKTRVPRAPSSSTERVRLQWCTTTDAVYNYYHRHVQLLPTTTAP